MSYIQWIWPRNSRAIFTGGQQGYFGVCNVKAWHWNGRVPLLSPQDLSLFLDKEVLNESRAERFNITRPTGNSVRRMVVYGKATG